MQTSSAGLALIKKSEGLTLIVKDDVGHEMIGYGHDLMPGESYPNGIDAATAESLLVADVAKVDAAMNAQHLALDLNQNQWDAVADFTYECGVYALVQLLAHGIDQIPEQLSRWVHAGGKVLPGMVARRAEEVKLYNS